MLCRTKRACGPAHAFGLRASTLSQADPQNPVILICTPSLSASARAVSNSDTTPPPLCLMVQVWEEERDEQPNSFCSAGLALAGGVANTNAATRTTIRMA